MTLTGLRARVEANTTERRVTGWLAGAEVRDVTGHELLGAEYETEACILDDGGEFIDDCLGMTGGFAVPPAVQPVPPGAPNDPTKVSDVKSFQTPSDLVTGDPFTTFAGIKCDMVTASEEVYLERSKRKHRYVESRQVDYHMARLISEQGNHMGDCPLSNMIYNAEYAAVNEYGGHAYMWMSMPLLLCAAQQKLISPCPPDMCVSATTMWRTPSGNYAIGIAHDDRVTASNFFLTGEVLMLRGPEESHVVNDVKNNVRKALTERVYVPLIECMAYHATATCDAPVTP